MHDVLGYDGTNVVVTGAASGMGAATAQILVELDAVVTAIDVRPTNVPVARFIEVDLRDPVAIEEAAATIDDAGVPVVSVDGGFQGARFTGRHQAGWADLIEGG